MPDDIEDFLKRAAQRRQAKTTPSKPAADPAQAPLSPAPQAQRAQAPPARPASSRPEYTSARSERIPRNRPEEEQPLQAILIEESTPAGQGVAEHMQRLKKQRSKATKDADTRRAGGSVQPVVPASQYVVPERAPSVAPQITTGDNSGFTASDRLITMLRQPEGMLQAILLQEILTRPEHRW
jgi:hypothetical protein